MIFFKVAYIISVNAFAEFALTWRKIEHWRNYLALTVMSMVLYVAIGSCKFGGRDTLKCKSCLCLHKPNMSPNAPSNLIALGIERIRVWSSSHHAINGGAVYRESHPRAHERTHIPERIGLCGPLSGCELYRLHQSMRCHLAAKFATRPNKASNMAYHNGQNVAVRSTKNKIYDRITDKSEIKREYDQSLSTWLQVTSSAGCAGKLLLLKLV